MIFGKFFGAIRAQFNKLANFFWEADPIAQMQYEYDLAVEQLKEGRVGLEQYRGLVERVTRQVKDGDAQIAKLTAQAKAYLKAGDRDTASKFALQLQKAKGQVDQNREQMTMHEQAYQNNLKKIQHANKKLAGETADIPARRRGLPTETRAKLDPPRRRCPWWLPWTWPPPWTRKPPWTKRRSLDGRATRVERTTARGRDKPTE